MDHINIWYYSLSSLVKTGDVTRITLTEDVRLADISQHYVKVLTLRDKDATKNMDEIFALLNSDKNPLSGNPEAQALIGKHGSHTSMTVGDVMELVPEGDDPVMWFSVGGTGFNLLT